MRIILVSEFLIYLDTIILHFKRNIFQLKYCWNSLSPKEYQYLILLFLREKSEEVSCWPGFQNVSIILALSFCRVIQNHTGWKCNKVSHGLTVLVQSAVLKFLHFLKRERCELDVQLQWDEISLQCAPGRVMCYIDSKYYRRLIKNLY